MVHPSGVVTLSISISGCDSLVSRREDAPLAVDARLLAVLSHVPAAGCRPDRPDRDDHEFNPMDSQISVEVATPAAESRVWRRRAAKTSNESDPRRS